MAQTVFKPSQIKTQDGEFVLKLTHDYAPQVEETETVEAEPVYEGPTADDLRREAEAFKVQWEAEKQEMLAQAQASADEILKKAQDSAFAEVKRQTDQAQVLKADAEANAQDIIHSAEEQAKQIIEQAQNERENIISGAKKQGFEQGQQPAGRQRDRHDLAGSWG